MSLHKSLVARDRLKRQRNVMTRWERILQLRKEEKWEGERSVFGLPKVRVIHHKKHKKAKKEEAVAEGVAPAEGAAAPAGAAAAPGAKPGAAAAAKPAAAKPAAKGAEKK
jgi:small basic protein (TIGR04137 family)